MRVTKQIGRRLGLCSVFLGVAGLGGWPVDGSRSVPLPAVFLGVGPTVASAQAPLKPEEQAALVLNAGNKAFNNKQYNVAAERFREYIQKFPNQKDVTAARYGLGLALLETNPRDFKNAIEALTPAAGVNEFVDRPYVLYQLALAHRGTAYDLWQQAIAKPNEAPALKQQALPQFASAATRFNEATVAFLARAKTAAPAPAAAAGELLADVEWANRARCDHSEMLLRQDKSKEAVELLAPWLVDATQSKSVYRPLALYLHGQAAFNLRDYAGSLRSLAALAPFTQPVFGAHAQYLLGRTHHLLEERVEAAARYDAVIAGYEKAKTAAQQQLQNGAALANQPDERARLEAFVRTAPDYVVRSQFHSAVLLQEQQKNSDALTRFTAFLQQQPQSPLADEAKLRQAMAQVELRQFQPAVPVLTALANHPVLADRALLWLGRATLNGADPAQAPAYAQALTTTITQLTQAAEKANQRVAQEPEAKQRRGEILLELGDLQVQARQFAPAAATFETGAKENISPLRNEEFLQRRATALHMAGQFDTSDQVCTQFAQSFPQSTLLPAVLFRAAENAFMRAAAIEPTQVPAKNADLAKWLGEAATRYKTLLEKYPEFPYASVARYRWAMTFYRQDNFVEALKLLQAIPSGDYQGELATAPYFHADCLLRAAPMDGTDALAVGRQLQALTEALKLLEVFIGAQPADGKLALPQTPDALLKLAYCQQKMAVQLADPAERTARLNSARQALERVTTQFPTSVAVPAATLERANCLIDLNDTGSAQNELSKFKQDPLKGSSVAPLAYVRLATLLRSQNKAADAATLLQEGRNNYEAALTNDPGRAAWAPLLAYHHALAVKESGKLVDAQKLFEGLIQKYAASGEAMDAAWRAGQCRREDAVTRLLLATTAARKAGAKPEEVAAANQQRAECVKQITETGTFLVQQATAVASKAAGSETHQRMLYEAAWCYQTLADVEIEAAQQKLNEEALKKFLEEQAKATGKPATGTAANTTAPAG
ncbi:MAG: tetratricopeptide repeat protein, partial [Planctomycetota bacterium]